MKLWSHSLAQQIVHMPSEEGMQARELLTRRYSSAALIVLPLSGGGFAIFDRGSQLLATAEPTDLPKALRQLSKEEEERSSARRAAEQARRESGATARSTAATAEDLGL